MHTSHLWSSPIFIHVPKAENSLSVIENKRFNSEGDEPEPKRLKKKSDFIRSSLIVRSHKRS